jgi:type IV pilus assembly protein PilV
MTTGALRRRHGGFSLVEVLVAMVVMAVGLLGIAGLYVEGLRAGRTSLYRTTAVTLAADMADRIRANALAGDAYAGAGPGADGGCVAGADDCDPATMAADDWFHWRTDLAERMPDGTEAELTVVDAPPLRTYAIEIRWPEPGQAEPSVYRLQVQL